MTGASAVFSDTTRQRESDQASTHTRHALGSVLFFQLLCQLEGGAIARPAAVQAEPAVGPQERVQLHRDNQRITQLSMITACPLREV